MRQTIAAILTASLALAACGLPSFNRAEPDGAVGSAPARIGDQEATDIRVLDGDSFELELAGQPVEVRLLGINTPEREECFGPEARIRATDLTAGARISVTGDTYDQFGRLLGYLFADGVLINAELVRSGHALAQSNDHELRGDFKELEARAAETGAGMWNPQACLPAADADVVIEDLEADAPGPDGENPNGEFVIIANAGQSAVNLDGWTVRDESSRHRYTFGELLLSPGASVTVFSGSGIDSDEELYWNATDPVWSNGGDTAYLLDPAGNYHARRTYVP